MWVKKIFKVFGRLHQIFKIYLVRVWAFIRGVILKFVVWLPNNRSNSCCSTTSTRLQSLEPKVKLYCLHVALKDIKNKLCPPIQPNLASSRDLNNFDAKNIKKIVSQFFFVVLAFLSRPEQRHSNLRLVWSSLDISGNERRSFYPSGLARGKMWKLLMKKWKISKLKSSGVVIPLNNCFCIKKNNINKFLKPTFVHMWKFIMSIADI